MKNFVMNMLFWMGVRVKILIKRSEVMVISFALAAIPYYMAYKGMLPYFFAIACAYAILTLVPAFSVYFLFRRKKQSILRSIWVFFKESTRPARTLVSLSGIILLTCVLLNEIVPAQLPMYELHNEKLGKTLYFQGMAHIASDGFYEEVRKRITSASEGGFALYYEQVGVEGQEDLSYLQSKMGFVPSAKFYQAFASSLGSNLGAQDNGSLIAAASASKTVRADVNISDLRALEHPQNTELSGALRTEAIRHDMSYTGVINSGALVSSGSVQHTQSGIEGVAPSLSTSINTPAIEINTPANPSTVSNLVAAKQEESIVTKIEDSLISEDTLKNVFSNDFVRYVIKAEFNLVAQSEIAQKFMLLFAGADPSFFSGKIIDYRNEKLAEKIITSEDNKIFITYGAMHFPGFVDKLNEISEKAGDGEWTVMKKEKIKVFK